MKVLYKIVNSITVLALIPVLLFLPMFRFIARVNVSSSSQILSILGSVLDVNGIISKATGIDLENMPEFYTIKDAYNLFFGDSAKISTADIDASVLPEAMTKYLTAAGVLFAIALVFALIVLFVGLFTKKKGLTAGFALAGTITAFASGKCFTYISSQLVSGKISMTQILSSIKSLADYKDYMSYIDIDIRLFRLDSAATMVMVILVAMIVLNIGFLLAEKATEK